MTFILRTVPQALEFIRAEKAPSGPLLPEECMFDLAMIALGIGFFVAAILYTSACNHL
jgi:hypothetical protein